jgi:HEAT repeat protein
MNDQPSETTATGNVQRSRFDVKHLVVLVAMLGVAAFAGWKIWADLLTDDETRQFRDTLQQLRSNDVSERWRAAGNLSLTNRKSEIEPAVSALVQALQDPDVQVKTTAAQTLGALGLKLQNPDDDKLALAPESVTKWVDQATRALGKSMTDPEAAVRVAAINGLDALSTQPSTLGGGGMGRSFTVGGGLSAKKPGFQPPPELAESLDSGETKWSRTSAQAFYGYLDTVPPSELVAAVKDPAPEVRAAAFKALKNFPLNLDSAIPLLFSALETGEAPVIEASNATLRLAWPTAAAIPPLKEALKSHTDTVRGLAALLLGRIGPESSSAVPDLIKISKQPPDPAASRSGSGRMQEDAACLASRALGSISSNDEVIAALTETLKSDVDYRHGAAAYGLTQIGDPARGAAPALVAAYSKWLASKNKLNIGRAMTTALGRLAPKTPAESDAVSLLIKATELKERSIPTEAAKALAKFGKSAAPAISRLRALKEENNSEAAAAALEAIEGTTPPKDSGSKAG